MPSIKAEKVGNSWGGRRHSRRLKAKEGQAKGCPTHAYKPNDLGGIELKIFNFQGVDVLRRKCCSHHPPLSTEEEQGKEEGECLSSSSQPQGWEVATGGFLKTVSLPASELLLKSN